MRVEIKTFALWCGCKYKGMSKDITGVAIDSRKIKCGDVFFAFKGEHLNGEDYAVSAIEQGAVLSVVSQSYNGREHSQIIRVEDVEKALQMAAKHYRETIQTKIVAITGSVGKTTTKDMLASVLSESYSVFSTRGNFNNEIGFPLMIFELEDKYEWAVLEMGMNHYGEIERLSDIAKQDIALITNIGTAHIEFFGSRENIAKAKFEIIKPLKASNMLVVNGYDDLLCEYKSNNFSVVSVGRSNVDPFYAKHIEIGLEGTTFSLHAQGRTFPVHLKLFGEHNVINALMAVAVGHYIGVSMNKIIKGLEQCSSPHMRFEKEYIQDVCFINDAYNASYDSIMASVQTFIHMPFKRHIVVLGDVFECGDYSERIHRKIGRGISDKNMHCVCFIGDAMQYAMEAYNGEKHYFNDILSCVNYLRQVLKAHDGVLIKGSRGMALEKLIEEYRSF